MPTTLHTSDLPGLPLIHRGKVRDVYELPGNRMAPPVTAAAAAGFLGLAAYGAWDRRPPFAAVALAVAAVLAVLAVVARREPHRIVLTDAGLTLHSSTKATSIAWQDLAGIVIRTGRYPRLGWVRLDGTRTDTLGVPKDYYRMLTEVQHRAPHVRVFS